MAFIGLFEIFLAVICFCFFIHWYFIKDNKGIPTNFPIVGMFPQLMCNVHRIHDWVAGLVQNSDCTFLFKGPWFLNMDILVTVNPANIHYITSTNFSNYPKGEEFYQIFDVLGDGIFNVDADSWRSQRKAAHVLMSHQRFQNFLVKTTMKKIEKGLIPLLDNVCKQCKPVDLQDVFQRFMFDSTCILVTGYDPGSLSNEFPEVPLAKAMEEAEEGIFYRHVVPEIVWKLQRWLCIGEEKKSKEAKEVIDHIIHEYIQKKRAELSKGFTVKEEEAVDLLTSYINEDYRLGIKSDDKFLRDTTLTLMAAGRDTVSSAITSFFWLVSMNPQVETKIREELKLVIPEDKMAEKWWRFDINEIKNKLVYLHGALCEAMRLYPPVPFQHKAPFAADILPSGHRTVPKTKILLPPYALGRLESVWGEDCLEFKPERWITETGGIKHEPSYKFFAFNAGPRTCLGKEISFVQMKAIAATIFHNYKFEVVEGQCFERNVSIILHLKYGLKMRMFKRWDDDQ